jgi:hypothetical protein
MKAKEINGWSLGGKAGCLGHHFNRILNIPHILVTRNCDIVWLQSQIIVPGAAI